MDQKTEKERVSALYRAGFTTREIKRLRSIRRMYSENEQDRASMDLPHLRFARWLVEHGRLTEECSESDIPRSGV